MRDANLTAENTILNPTAWADAMWPVTVIEQLYAPAAVTAADEHLVTILVRGVETRISWSVLRDCVAQGGKIGMIYYFLAQEADRIRDQGRVARLLAAGYTVSSREVGQRFGREGVISYAGGVVMTGALMPFDAHSGAERQVVDQWMSRGQEVRS